MAPQVNKMQVQPQVNQTNFSTMPSAPPMQMTMSLPAPIQPVRPNPVSEISQILARMNTQSTQRREEIKLPVYNPIGYGKTKAKKPIYRCGWNHPIRIKKQRGFKTKVLNPDCLKI
jgi:hypothetical protein